MALASTWAHSCTVFTCSAPEGTGVSRPAPAIRRAKWFAQGLLGNEHQARAFPWVCSQAFSFLLLSCLLLPSAWDWTIIRLISSNLRTLRIIWNTKLKHHGLNENIFKLHHLFDLHTPTLIKPQGFCTAEFLCILWHHGSIPTLDSFDLNHWHVLNTEANAYWILDL